jgi:hypothetical protein
MPRKATAVENTTPIQAIEAVAEPTGNGSIPPPDAPQDVGKYARFLVDDTVTATTGDVAVCTVGVPGKTSFFRAHPDPAFYPHLRCLVFEGEGRKHPIPCASWLTTSSPAPGSSGGLIATIRGHVLTTPAPDPSS